MKATMNDESSAKAAIEILNGTIIGGKSIYLRVFSDKVQSKVSNGLNSLETENHIVRITYKSFDSM